MHMEARGQLGGGGGGSFPRYRPLVFLFETGSLTALELSEKARLAGQ